MPRVNTESGHVLRSFESWMEALGYACEYTLACGSTAYVNAPDHPTKRVESKCDTGLLADRYVVVTALPAQTHEQAVTCACGGEHD